MPQPNSGYLLMPQKSAYHGADPKIVQDQLASLQMLFGLYGRPGFCAMAPIYILRKEPEPEPGDEPISSPVADNATLNRKLVPFRFNRAQMHLSNRIGRNNLLLKFRQGGFTTFFIICRLFITAILEPGTSGLLISQSAKYGAKHFDILRRADQYFLCANPLMGVDNEDFNAEAVSFQHHLLHKRYSARHEIVYDMLESRVVVDTAENTEVGQGLPGINHLVSTEVSRWPHVPEETMANVSESVTPNGTQDQEWTANGWGNYAFEESQRSQRGQSIYKFHFYPWFWHEEYQLDSPERERYIKSFEECTEEENEVRKIFKLTLGQVAWRRKKQIALRHNFKEKYPEDPVSCFLTTGNNFFETEIIRKRALSLKANPVLVAHNVIKENGYFDIYRTPLMKCRYALYADVAWGRTEKTKSPDWSAFSIVDIDTGVQYASYHAYLPPEDYAQHIFEAAKYFNNAVVGVERNPGGGGETVLLCLRQTFAYGNIFCYKEWDKDKKNVLEIPGIPTTTRTRPIMVNRLAQLLREEPELFFDPLFFDEAMTFVRSPDGVPRAITGSHDDTVMANAGVQFLRWIVLGYFDPLESESQSYER